MNVMALHAEAAATLGVRVGALRKGLFFCSGLLTASAVTSAGSDRLRRPDRAARLPLCLSAPTTAC